MSPRPTKAVGNVSRRPNTRVSTSTYFPVATLPSSTTSAAGPSAASSARAVASAGARYRSFAASIGTPASSARSWCETVSSAGTRPRDDVITYAPATPCGGRANARAHGQREHGLVAHQDPSPAAVEPSGREKEDARPHGLPLLRHDGYFESTVMFSLRPLLLTATMIPSPRAISTETSVHVGPMSSMT